MLFPPSGEAAAQLGAVLPDPVPRSGPELAELLRKLAGTGALDLPAPGGGRTRERWSALTALGRADLVLGRLAEGHTDALAILAAADHDAAPHPGGAAAETSAAETAAAETAAAETAAAETAAAETAAADGGGMADGRTWGVWASGSGGTGVTAARAGDGWRLEGRLRFCSGATLLDSALVVADAPDGRRLFAVDLTDPGVRPIEGSWPAVGMDASDSLDVAMTGARAVPVREPGWYAGRAGFAVGGIGVAAVWFGGALGVVDDVLRTAPPEPDAHVRAHLGACVVALAAADAALDRAAAAVDADPAGDHRGRALAVRATVEETAQTVLRRAGRITGPTPLCRDAVHAHRTADLLVYVRQQHAERDLATLGTAVLDGTFDGR